MSAVFDTARADRSQGFFEKILVHTKGAYARKPFILPPWQRDGILRPLFGTVIRDEQLDAWVRQYRLAWIELARKNGKSEILAGIALQLLCADGEESGEIYGAACDRDQAALVFNVAKRMVELSPVLSKRLEVIDSRKRIVDPKTNSVYQVIAADAGGALGTNPSGIIFDEILTQPNRELWDALKTGMGARAQPLMVAATTAGTNAAQFCLEESEYSARVHAARERGEEMDPSRFVFMRNTLRDQDWTDEGHPATETEPATGWYWPNPALGDFLSLHTLRAEAVEAKEKPQSQNAFRQFRLNQWVSQSSRWLDMTVWDANGVRPVTRDDLADRKAFGGLDLASTTDLASWVLVFPEDEGGYTSLSHFWIPRPAMERRSPMKEQFRVWAEAGLLTVIDGDTIDYDAIEAHIGRDAEAFSLKMFGFDPWNATQVVGHLEDGGLVGVKVPQTCSRLNSPSKELERALIAREFHHGGNPLLRWQAEHVEAVTDGEGNIKPSRKKSSEKIDGIAATVNALFVALLPPEDDAPVSGFVNLEDYLS